MRAAVLLSGLVVCAASAVAQVRTELAPRIGLYVPVTQARQYFYGLNGTTLAVQANQRTTGFFGGKVTVWLSRLGLEGDVWYAPSDLMVRSIRTSTAPDGGTVVDTSVAPIDAGIVVGSARALLDLPISTGPARLHVLGGVGARTLDGDRCDAPGGTTTGACLQPRTTHVAFVVGGGARFMVARRASIRADVESHVSSLDSRIRNELVLSLGMALAVGGN